MKRSLTCISIASILILSGCKKEQTPDMTREFTYEFQTGTEGWQGDFADYPDQPGVETFYAFQFAHSMLPAPLNTNEGGLKQSGRNHSDDLFMFVKKKISGLEPGRKYELSISVEFASNAADGLVGVGGAPGESVYIKAGASALEPVKVLNNTDGHFRMNIDKGNQSTDGADMKLIGNFANGTSSNNYNLKKLATAAPLSVKADANGSLWLIVGTDSGFEATTTIYYNSIKAVLK